MAVNPRKRQKKQEHRAAKRKLKHQQLAREKSVGLSGRMTAAARYPVLDSWVSEDLWAEGLGWVTLSRRLPNGSIALAVFLIDRYCLGVKDVMAEILGPSEYAANMQRMRGRFIIKNLPPETVRKFVEGAVAYAASHGIRPHADYHKAKLIFGDLDPAASTEDLEFGKGGKPFFVAGPYDDMVRCDRILKTLEASCGPDGYHYAIPFADDGGAPPPLDADDIPFLPFQRDDPGSEP